MATIIRLSHDLDGVGEIVLRMEFPGSVAMDEPLVASVLPLLIMEYRERGLVSARFRQEPSTNYTLRFIDADGKMWHQNLAFMADPEITISTDPWKLSYVQAQRPLRDHVVSMHQNIGLHTLNFDFTAGL